MFATNTSSQNLDGLAESVVKESHAKDHHSHHVDRRDRPKHSFTGLRKGRGLPRKGGRDIGAPIDDIEAPSALNHSDPNYDETPQYVYRLVEERDWNKAIERKEYLGNDTDRKSGFIHLSTADQVHRTAELFFRDVSNLMLVEYVTEAIANDLAWETVESRDDIFPHYYGNSLPVDKPAVSRVIHVPLGPDGKHVFPEL